MDKLTQIKYIGIEVIKKDGTGKDDITSGFFLGVWDNWNRKEKQNFIVIMDSKTTVRLFNTQFYNVLALKILDNETEYLTVFKKELEDQESAIKMLNGFVELFRTDNKLMTTDATGQLIDPNEYFNYPKAILEGKDLTDTACETDPIDKVTNLKNANGSTKTNNNYNHNANAVNKGYGAAYSDPYGYGYEYGEYGTTKTATVTYLTRKGAPLSIATLNTMKDKVKRLATGDYTVTNIPVPKCDELDTIADDYDKKNLPTVVM